MKTTPQPSSLQPAEAKLAKDFARLALLEDGWLDGEGKAYDPAQLAWLQSHFQAHLDSALPLPLVFPNVEGRVVFEWPMGQGSSLELEIDLDAQRGDLELMLKREFTSIEFELKNGLGWDALFAHMATWLALGDG